MESRPRILPCWRKTSYELSSFTKFSLKKYEYPGKFVNCFLKLCSKNISRKVESKVIVSLRKERLKRRSRKVVGSVRRQLSPYKLPILTEHFETRNQFFIETCVRDSKNIVRDLNAVVRK